MKQVCVYVDFKISLFFDLYSPPGSPTALGFFPSPSSLSSPGGLVRMPGLTYNSNGVKDLINSVQGYQVRDIFFQVCLTFFVCMQMFCAFKVHIPHRRIHRRSPCIMGVYCQASTLFAQRLSNSFILSTLPVLSHTLCCLLRLELDELLFEPGGERRISETIRNRSL